MGSRVSVDPVRQHANYCAWMCFVHGLPAAVLIVLASNTGGPRGVPLLMMVLAVVLGAICGLVWMFAYAYSPKEVTGKYGPGSWDALGALVTMLAVYLAAFVGLGVFGPLVWFQPFQLPKPYPLFDTTNLLGALGFVSVFAVPAGLWILATRLSGRLPMQEKPSKNQPLAGLLSVVVIVGLSSGRDAIRKHDIWWQIAIAAIWHFVSFSLLFFSAVLTYLWVTKSFESWREGRLNPRAG